MPKDIDFFKMITGESFDDLTHLPDFDDILKYQTTALSSKYRLRELSPALFFSEEQRPNIHVIGSSRQGKSYFIEWLMREDIKRGLGCCLLDPSAGGSTAYRLLAYCLELGKENVLFIDKAHSYSPHKKAPSFQPFRYGANGEKFPKMREESIDALMKAVRDLYHVKDPSEQSRIERYLPPVFYALYDAELPLVAAKYFGKKIYKYIQDEILSYTDFDTSLEIKEALGTYLLYQNFQSTVSRMLRFTDGYVGNLFGQDKGVNWLQAVRDNWIVIVRLDNIDKFDARLIGTYIIAELVTAKQKLGEIMDRGRDFTERGKYPPFYLYADEAFMFASQSLQEILDIRQKLNFKLTLAHHYAGQFDKEMYESIKVNSDMTVQFYVRGRGTRDDISSEMYGGDIDPKDASYANSNLSRQQAVIKIGKDSPARTRLPDVPTPKVSGKDLDNYLIDLYHRLTDLDWYHDSDAPRKLPAHFESLASRKVDDDKATGKAAVPKRVRRKPQEDIRPDQSEPPKAKDRRPIKI